MFMCVNVTYVKTLDISILRIIMENFEDQFAANFAIRLSTIVLGFLIFMKNILLFALLRKLLLSAKGNKDKLRFLHQTLSVCILDGLCGIGLSLTGLIFVNGITSASFCAYVLFASISFQLMSQGNITCICAQRFLIARNIRQKSNTNFMHSRILIAVNASIGILAMTSFAVQASIKNKSLGLCTLSNVIDERTKFTASVFFIPLGVIFTIFADILCIFTIVKLKSQMRNTVNPLETDAAETTGGSLANFPEHPQSTKQLRQRKAVLTICIIVIFFNCSLVPAILTYSLLFAGVYVPVSFRNFIYLTFFLNSLANPVIIALRIEDIRIIVGSVFLKLKARVQHCLCF